MLNSRHFGLFGAIVGGSLGVAFSFAYQPFPNCTEFAMVDSILVVVHKDRWLDPDLAPYLGYTTLQYYQGSCHVKQQVDQPYDMPAHTSVIEYTPTSTPRVYDFTRTRVPIDMHEITGTQYYSVLGGVDSTRARNIATTDSGKLDTSYSEVRYISKPDYQLIQFLLSKDANTWEFPFLGDSIVSGPNGTTIFSGEGNATYETRCGVEGLTYVCQDSVSQDGRAPRKSIWFLTQGRKDSLQTWEDGELISTEKYFWSARTAGIRSPRVRKNLTAANSVWYEFDIMGRARLELRNPDKTTSDRNKAWPRSRY